MKKILYRNSNNSKIAGVCIGISDYFDIDSVIVRLFFLTLFFLGPGFIIYIICWIIIPLKKIAHKTQQKCNKKIIVTNHY